MSYPHNLRAPTSPFQPEAVGICDRCGFLRKLVDLPYQFDWRGNALQNLRLRVCVERCLDAPAEQLRPIIIQGPEGVILDPRPAHWTEQAQGGPDGPRYPSGTFPPPQPQPGDQFILDHSILDGPDVLV